MDLQKLANLATDLSCRSADASLEASRLAKAGQRDKAWKALGRADAYREAARSLIELTKREMA